RAGSDMKELKIRKDRTPAVLRKLAKDETDARVARRILAIANALSGMNRAEAAGRTGMDRQTLRDWVIRWPSRPPCPPEVIGYAADRVRRRCRQHSRRDPILPKAQGYRPLPVR